MRTKVFVTIASLLVLGRVVFAAVPSKADAISDILTVFTPAGTISQIITANESQEGNGGDIFFIGVTGLADPAAFGNPTTLCEPGTSPCDATTPFASLSDIVGVVKATILNQTFYLLGFKSDDESGFMPAIQADSGRFGDTFIVEQANPNQIIDVTSLLDPTLRSAGWTGTFQSEFVPEPGTMLCLARVC